jgi:hypothetical protein
MPVSRRTKSPRLNATALSCEFSPLLRQAFILLFNGRVAIGEPLALVGPGAAFVKLRHLRFETRVTNWQGQTIVHGLILVR